MVGGGPVVVVVEGVVLVVEAESVVGGALVAVVGFRGWATDVSAIGEELVVAWLAGDDAQADTRSTKAVAHVARWKRKCGIC